MKPTHTIPLDIHTHHHPACPGTAIVSCCPAQFIPQPGGRYSAGIHPWHAAEPDTAAQEEALQHLLSHPQLLAVGEAGLDKLSAAPMEVQLPLFERQARLAAEAGKPLIIHTVRATDALLRLKRQLRPQNPWIIHGFRGKASLAEEFLRHGFFLSFGERYQEETLRHTPADRLLLETDESVVPIQTLLQRAASLRGVTAEELQATLQENVKQLFFG